MRKNIMKSILKMSLFGTMIFTLLSTIYPMKSDAADFVKQAIFVRSEKGYEFAKYPDYTGDEGSRKILNSHYSVFCCAHGTSVAQSNSDNPIRIYVMGGNNTGGEDDDGGTDVDEISNPELRNAIENAKKVLQGITVRNKTRSSLKDEYTIEDQVILAETPAGYKKVGHGEAANDYLESWIIANLNEKNIDHNGSPMQLAWWCTPSGFQDQYGTENEYYRSAVKFKEYIKSVSNGKYRQKPYYDEFTGYDINPPSWKDTTPVVSYHPAENGEDAFYLIGPYAFENYKYMNDGDNLHVDFCKVSSFQVKTDKSNGYVEAKKSKDDKDGDRNLLIVAKETGKKKNEDGSEKIDLVDVNFPDDGKNFYIKMYDKGRFKDSTSIKDIKVEFRYVNVWAYFNFLEGDKKQYEFDEKVYPEMSGQTQTGMWFHELVLKRKGKGVQSQTLTTDARGLYWFEFYELHRGIELNYAKIAIQKSVVNAAGEVIDPKDLDKEIFNFTLKVNGASTKEANLTEETINVSTKDTAPAQSNVYYWDDKDGTPTFTLKENEDTKNKHKYRLADVKSKNGTVTIDENGVISGKLENGTINLQVYNEILPKQGYIKVKKTIEKNDTGALGQTISGDKTFLFNVTVSGDFFYINEFNEPVHYSGDGKLIVNDFAVTVKDGELEGEAEFNNASRPIYWYGDAPTVYIEEVNSENYESAEELADENKKYTKTAKLIGTDVTVDNTGKMSFEVVDKENVTNLSKLTFKNKDKIHKAAKIKIIKRVDISAVKDNAKKVELMLSAIKKLTFTFQIDVIDGDKVTTLDNAFLLEGATAKISKDGNFIEIIKTLDKDITWIGNTAPDYRITEINVPAGTEFVSAETAGQKTEGEPERSVRGTLREESTAGETIDNTIINKLREHRGKIDLTKIFGSLTDEESKTKINEAIKNGGVLLFNVDLEGEFLYGDDDATEIEYKEASSEEPKPSEEPAAPAENGTGTEPDILDATGDGEEDETNSPDAENAEVSYGDEIVETAEGQGTENEAKNAAEPAAEETQPAAEKTDATVNRKIRLVGNVDKADYEIVKYIVLQADGKPDPRFKNDDSKSVVMKPEVTFDKNADGTISNINYTNNKAITKDIIWYGENAPSYTISEDVSKLGVEVIKPKDVEGKFEALDQDTTEPKLINVDVVFNNTINKPDLRYANLVIKKKLLGTEGLKIEDYKDKNYRFKFIVNVHRTPKVGDPFQNADETNKVVYIDGVQVGENSMEWVWNGENENDLIYWDPVKENAPYITVDEVLSDDEYSIPEGVTFDSANVLVGSGETPGVEAEYTYYGKADDKIVHLVKAQEDPTAEEDRKIPLKDLEDTKKIFTVECNFNNKLNGPDTTTSKINIIKKLAGKDADSMVSTDTDDKPFKFKVTITAEHEFKYLSKTYPAGTYYLDSEDGIVTDGNNAEVVIRVTDKESKTNNWTSEEFIWNNKDAEGKDIKYLVEEINVENGVEHTITNKEGSLKNSANIDVECTNSKEIKTGKVKIIKTVSTDKISEERAKSYVFSFDINVDGYTAPIRVTLDKDSLSVVDNRYTWEKDVEGIALKSEGETKAQIQEVNVPEGFEFVKFEGQPDGENSIIVTLKDGEENAVTINCTNKYVEPKTMKGKIDIHKDVTSSTLSGEFSFTVNLKGASFKAKYGDQTSGESYVTSHTFDVKVQAGETKSIEVEWPEGVSNPEYEVIENVSDDAVYEVKEIKNSKGIVSGVLTNVSESPATTVTVNAVNAPKEVGGYIKFRKVVKAKDTFGYNSLNDLRVDDEFTFKVEVSYDGGTTRKTIATPTIKQNDVWVSQRITWEKTGSTPIYYITEVNMIEGYDAIEPISGEVPEASTPETVPEDKVVTITNVKEVQHGKFKVDKHIIGDLKVIDLVDMPEFKFRATVKGKFYYKNVYYDNTASENKELVINFTLESLGPKDKYSTFELPEDIYWATEDSPTVTIEETNVKAPWECIGISNGGKAGASLIKDSTISIVASNKLVCVDEKIFRVDLGGTVWEDEEYLNDKNNPNSKDGIMNDNEKRIENVEVYVYEDGQLADLRDTTGVVIQQPIYTDSNGNWKAEGIKLPSLATQKYHVEFAYDGQTYEPTKFLAKYGNMRNSEKSKEYMNSSTLRENHIDNSMALDKNRDEVNDRINEVYGYASITGDGKTVGEVKSTTGVTNKINYQANIVDLDTYGQSDNKIESLKSKLQTRDSSGKIYDVFKAIASTNTGDAQLLFPASGAVRIAADSPTKVIEERDGENVLVNRTEYVPVGSYMKHINLGLVRRPDAGLMTTKKLTSANVVTRNGIVHYEFKKLTELVNNNGVITREYKGVNANEDPYTYGREQIDLYGSDYYYREEIYNSDPNYNLYESKVKNTEMEVYLNYVLTVVNESSEYKVKINSINDYFNNTLEIVNEQIGIDDEDDDRYIDSNRIFNDAGNVIKNPTFNISDGTRFTIYTNGNTSIKDVTWHQSASNIKGSDGSYYTKVTANLGDKCILEPAGNTLSDNDKSRLDMNITLKVKKDKLRITKNEKVSGMIMAIATGNKSNIVEVANYSTLDKTTGKNAGKIDSDSAADNINIANYNEKYWYEDDTYAAPRLDIRVDENTKKTVKGKAWEDNSEKEGNTGLGVNEDDEARIGGLTTQLPERITVGTKTIDYLWPTSKPLSSLGGLSVEDVTGFDSTTETSRVKKDEDHEAGSYEFVGMASGDYLTRFVYGNDKSKLEDKNDVTGSAIALTADGELFNKVVANTTSATGYSANQPLGSAYTLTANYTAQDKDNTPAVYNGQDYKTTIYRYDNNSEGADNNDARDNEDRRLKVMAKSTTITNYNSEILGQANVAGGYHDELYRDYEMTADTDATSFKTANVVEARNVDVGLVERPRNDIILDKEINSIKITSNDNKTIFDAEYNIEYMIAENVGSDAEKVLARFMRDGKSKYLMATVTLDKVRSVNYDVMQAINKQEDKRTDYNSSSGLDSIKNFRYINVDEDILQGSTISLGYKFTAINVGEEDYTTETIANLASGYNKDKTKTQETVLYELSEQVKNAKSDKTIDYEPGMVLGAFYYTGETEFENKAPVRSRIRQIVDYADMDAVFDATFNNTRDGSWRNALVSELAGNGVSKDRLLSKKITSVNRLYDKDERAYMEDSKNNIVLSMDEMDEKGSGFDNSGFEKQLVPVGSKEIQDGKLDINDSSFASELFLVITRTVSSQDDANNLAFDNVSEIVKGMNTVGRRDIKVVSGNANPKLGEFTVAIKERDSSATELVTFTPPTGIDVNKNLMNQILIMTTVALMIVGAGVIIIKRTMKD